MTVTARQYQSLQSEACRMAEELPRTQLLDSLIAAYDDLGNLAIADIDDDDHP